MLYIVLFVPVLVLMLRGLSRVKLSPQMSHQSVTQTRVDSTARTSEGHYSLRVGEALGAQGRYTAYRLIGEGTYGRVIRAWDQVAEVHVAIKIIRSLPSYRRQAAHETKMLHVIDTQDDLSHIVRLQEHFMHGDHPCMVFELLPLTLHQQLHETDKYWTETAIRQFGQQLFSTLQFLHAQNVVHGDLKTTNVMLQSSLQNARVIPETNVDVNLSTLLGHESMCIKLIDFGLADILSSPSTRLRQSLQYRSPEVALGLAHGVAIDMWSAGCILFEVATRRMLFRVRTHECHLTELENLLGPPPAVVTSQLGRPFIHSFTRLQALTSLQRKFSYHTPWRRAPPIYPGANALLDLLLGLLTWDPAVRLTANQALQHAFFTQS